MKGARLIVAVFLGVAATTAYASDHTKEDLEQSVCYTRQLEQYCSWDHRCTRTVKAKRTARLNQLCLRYRARYGHLPQCCDRTDSVPDAGARQRIRERRERIRQTWQAGLCGLALETSRPGETEGARMAREQRLSTGCTQFRRVFPFDALPECCPKGSEH